MVVNIRFDNYTPCIVNYTKDRQSEMPDENHNTENEKSIPFANCRNSWRTFAEFEWNVDAATLELLMGHRLPGVSGSHYLRPTIDQLYETFSSQYAEYFLGLRQS